MLTTAARSLASFPSGRSGCSRNRVSVTIRPRTESPRNSSRSLVGRPPFSYAKDLCVSARSSSSALTWTRSLASRTEMSASAARPSCRRHAHRVPPLPSPAHLLPRHPGRSGSPDVSAATGSGRRGDDLAAVVSAAGRAGRVRQLGIAALRAGHQAGAVVFHCGRRDRVLLRDIFRFGTATSELLLNPPGPGVPSGVFPVCAVLAGGEQVLQHRPDAAVARVSVPGSASASRTPHSEHSPAQSGAQRRQRQCRAPARPAARARGPAGLRPEDTRHRPPTRSAPPRTAPGTGPAMLDVNSSRHRAHSPVSGAARWQ